MAEFKERFISPFRGTREEAEQVLANIRACHPESSGWVELDAGIELDPETNQYYAFREHKKIS